MPSERSAQAWGDIATNARHAIDWTGDLTAAGFAADTLTFYAVTRALEIISEAARRLESSEREARPEQRRVRHALQAQRRLIGAQDGNDGVPGHGRIVGRKSMGGEWEGGGLARSSSVGQGALRNVTRRI